MAQSQRSRTIKHVVAGGWDTDSFVANVVPDQTNVVAVPFLIKCENVLFRTDGALQKAWGTKALMAALSETNSEIKGLYDFWRSVGSTPAQHRILHLDDAIYKDDGDALFTTLATGLTPDAVPNYSQFDDMVIIASDAVGDVPKSWNGTTFQNLAGTPPNFAFSVVHNAHVFAAGVDANPSTLYFSVPNDPEDWVGAGSGSIQIDPDDGDRITGMISYKGKLIVFKGPYKGSIHVISGSSSSDFARAPLQDGIGAVWQNSIFRFGDDVGFMWSDGNIYSLQVTSAFGDFRFSSQLTRPISNFIDQRVNFNRLRHVTIAVNEAKGAFQACMPIDSSTQPNFILHCDYRFDPVRFSAWFALSGYTCVALVIDSAGTDRPTFMYGGNDKRVWIGERSARLDKEVTQISADIEFPFTDYGAPDTMKTFMFAGVGIEPKNNSNFTLAWVRDNQSEQSATLTQSGGAVLGDADDNEFILGTSTLGGGLFSQVWVDLHNAGQFRYISHRVRSSSGDFTFDNIAAGYHIDRVSLEN